MGIIRLLLAIAVIIAHTNPILGLSFTGGATAVKAFYIISGFYMALILNEKYIGAGSYKIFLANRFLRIFPIYWTLLILTIVISIGISYGSSGKELGFFMPYEKYSASLSIGSYLFLIFVNLFVVFQDFVVFLGLNLDSGDFFFTSNFWNTNPQLWLFLLVPQAWTISLELIFYTIAPFIVRRKIGIIILLILASIGLRILLAYNGLKDDPWSYRFFPTELAFFLLGSISYRLYKRILRYKVDKRILGFVYVFVIGFYLLYSILTFPFKSYIFLTSFFIAIPFVFYLTKSWKIDSALGELSYPIYISHFLIIRLLESNTLVKGNSAIVTLLISLILSLALNYFVARRFERIRLVKAARIPIQ